MAMYMKLDGIDGDVTTKGYEKWVEIEEINFGVNRSISTATGKTVDRENTKTAVSEIQVIKLADKTSPLVFMEACQGKARKDLKIHICQTGDKVSPYIEYTLNNVLVSHYAIEAKDVNQHANAMQGVSAVPREKLSFNFDKIEMKYTPYNEKNDPDTPVTTAYDLTTATKV